MGISRRRFLTLLGGLAIGGGVAAYLGKILLFPPTTTTTTNSSLNLSVSDFIQNLEIPWSLAFAPDGRIFFTERVGRIRIFENGALSSNSFAEPQVATAGEGGLLELVLDPSFQQNHYLYAYYTYQSSSGQLFNRVVRYTDSNNVGTSLTVIIDGIPAGYIHDGGRIKFGPDGKLNITTGESGSPNLAQDLNSLGGKILRVNSDGSIPSDNPFPNSAVYTYGNRNPQGLDWHPISGELYESEHGPTGEFGQYAHDEIFHHPYGTYTNPKNFVKCRTLGKLKNRALLISAKGRHRVDKSYDSERRTVQVTVIEKQTGARSG